MTIHSFPTNQILEKLLVTRLIKELFAFMEPRHSLLCLQEPSLDCILSHFSPGHILLSYFFKVRFNIILPSTPRPLHLTFCQNSYLHHPSYRTRPFYPP